MDQRILLVEPKIRTSYPPLGLMKIATYHRLKGDSVHFVVGKDVKRRDEKWDKIYITSVFTYDFNGLVDTIKFYRGNFFNMDKLCVGGISATLLASKLEAETGVVPHKGLLDEDDDFLISEAKKNEDLRYLFECKSASIDNLPPDYSIFGPEELKRYSKVVDNAFLFFSTKGCPNKCGFCVVRKLEPLYVDYIPIKPRIEYMRKHFGDRAGLLLLDNNIAASTSYFRIIDEIKDCGFAKDEKLVYLNSGRPVKRNRFVDFNQGVDLRLMDEAKMKKMAEIAIKPLRLAFDSIELEKEYEKKMRMAIYFGIKDLSNYMLFNFNDSPDDLYRRFQVNMRILKDHPDVKIFSFPMRYSPIESTDRKFIGKHWSKREVRAIQIILNATHGIVSHKNKFFNRAFGYSPECFRKVLLYPYHYLINRNIYEYNNLLIQQWEHDYSVLSAGEKKEFFDIVKGGVLTTLPATNNMKISCLLEHYDHEHANILQCEAYNDTRF